jgi:hypothetical protein
MPKSRGISGVPEKPFPIEIVSACGFCAKRFSLSRGLGVELLTVVGLVPGTFTPNPPEGHHRSPRRIDGYSRPTSIDRNSRTAPWHGPVAAGASGSRHPRRQRGARLLPASRSAPSVSLDNTTAHSVGFPAEFQVPHLTAKSPGT